MLTDAEIGALARWADAGVEVSLFLGPRGAWDTGGQSLVTSAAGGVARGGRESTRRGRGAPGCALRHPLVPRRRSRRARALGELRRAGELPPRSCSRPPSCSRARTPIPPASSTSRRDDDQRLDRPLSRRARRATDGLLRGSGRLRRGAGRPGRLRALLRRPGHRPGRRAGIREARAPKRAEHLPVGAAPRGARGQAGRERVRRAELVLRLLEELSPDLVEGRGDERPADLGIARVALARGYLPAAGCTGFQAGDESLFDVLVSVVVFPWRSTVAIAPSCENAIVEPSGRPGGLERVRAAEGEAPTRPSESVTTYRSYSDPTMFDAKTIRLLSGDHAGLMLLPCSDVRRAPEPSGRMT